MAKRVEWKRVIGALADDETRAVALARFRASGFSADSFRSRKAREVLVEGLVTAEDWLESSHRRRESERAVIRGVRRQIELELWP